MRTHIQLGEAFEMAGPFVHMTVCEEVFKRIESNPDLHDLIKPHLCCFLLGAVSPDAPYFNENPDWSNVFHNWDDNNKNTNAMPVAGLMDVRGRWASVSENDKRFTVWLMGYVAHMMTDVVIHPLVNRLAGAPYIMHKKEHRHCEMIQDSMLFMDYHKVELRDAGFIENLRECPKDDPTFGIAQYWLKMLTGTYPTLENTVPLDPGSSYAAAPAEQPHFSLPEQWLTAITGLLDFADGHSDLSVLFKEFGFIYQKTDEIDQECKEIFYNDIPLNDERTEFGPYKDKVFEDAVKAVCDILPVLFNWVRSGDGKPETIRGIVQNWNLDTGNKREWEPNV